MMLNYMSTHSGKFHCVLARLEKQGLLETVIIQNIDNHHRLEVVSAGASRCSPQATAGSTC